MRTAISSFLLLCFFIASNAFAESSVQKKAEIPSSMYANPTSIYIGQFAEDDDKVLFPGTYIHSYYFHVQETLKGQNFERIRAVNLEPENKDAFQFKKGERYLILSKGTAANSSNPHKNEPTILIFPITPSNVHHLPSEK